MVDFIDNDIDHPLVMAHLYTAADTLPDAAIIDPDRFRLRMLLTYKRGIITQIKKTRGVK